MGQQNQPAATPAMAATPAVNDVGVAGVASVKPTEDEKKKLKMQFRNRKKHLSKDYEVRKKLGEGNFALVRLCTRKRDKKDFAVKIIHRKRMSKPKQQVALEREIEILMSVDHPNCVKLQDIRETQNHVYLVLELCEGGELFDMICKAGKFTELQAVRVIEQITSALLYLHNRGIVHRDIKPENILLLEKSADSVVKLTDFGLANKIEGPINGLKTSCGTLYYAAPEVLGPGPYQASIDYWSLGVVLYVLLVGYLPFYHDAREETINQIRRARVHFDMKDWGNISVQARDIIRKLLTKDAKSRLNGETLMAHEWMTSNLKDESVVNVDKLKKFQDWKNGFTNIIDTVVAIQKWKRLAGVETKTPLRTMSQLAREDDPFQENAKESGVGAYYATDNRPGVRYVPGIGSVHE